MITEGQNLYWVGANLAQQVRDFGFLGDKDNPVQIEDMHKLPSIVMHSLVHAHEGDRCVKNRHGAICGS